MNFKSLPPWLDGGMFGALMVPLIFFLKVMCPLNTGCFADPFVVVMFSPLVVLESFVTGPISSAQVGILFITIFWGVIGALSAHLLSAILNRQNKKFSFDEERGRSDVLR
jgi:hypothetical protein